MVAVAVLALALALAVVGWVVGRERSSSCAGQPA